MLDCADSCRGATFVTFKRWKNTKIQSAKIFKSVYSYLSKCT